MGSIVGKGMSKSKGVSSGVKLTPGRGDMIHGQQRTGSQKPGVSGVSKGGGNQKFGATGGNGKMFGKQAATAAPAGRSGKGGSGSTSGGSRKRGYGGDANGNPY